MRTKRGRTPELLLKKPGFAVIKHEGRSFLIYKRVRRSKDGTPLKRRKRRKARRPSPKVEFIYLLSNQIHEKPRWNLDHAVVDSVRRHFALKFAEKDGSMISLVSTFGRPI
jgi:hypothetical protein